LLHEAITTTSSLVNEARYINDSTLLTMSTAELAASYAALILADDGVEVTVSALLLAATFQHLQIP